MLQTNGNLGIKVSWHEMLKTLNSHYFHPQLNHVKERQIS